MLCTVFAVVAIAQTPAPPPRTNQPATSGATGAAAATGGTGAEGKIALVYFASFREGITEMKTKLDALNAEFDPKNKEMQALRDKIESLNNQIKTQGGTAEANNSATSLLVLSSASHTWNGNCATPTPASAMRDNR